MSELKIGEKIIEGKTKIVYALPDSPDGNHVLLKSKDKITAFDATRKNDMAGKAAFSNATTSAIFELLNTCGIKTHFIKRAESDPEAFIGMRCEMIPLEVVTRRIATGWFELFDLCSFCFSLNIPSFPVLSWPPLLSPLLWLVT